MPGYPVWLQGNRSYCIDGGFSDFQILKVPLPCLPLPLESCLQAASRFATGHQAWSRLLAVYMRDSHVPRHHMCDFPWQGFQACASLMRIQS